MKDPKTTIEQILELTFRAGGIQQRAMLALQSGDYDKAAAELEEYAKIMLETADLCRRM